MFQVLTPTNDKRISVWLPSQGLGCPYLENLRASICVFTLPSTHTQFRPNQVEACRAHIPREVLILYRQQSQHLPATPLGSCPCTIKCLSCLKYPTFKQKVLEAFCFLQAKMHILKNLTFQQVSQAIKKKNKECLKSLFYFTKMLREPHQKKKKVKNIQEMKI